jgi:RimJ/RimL family protein N-acetyltransferase
MIETLRGTMLTLRKLRRSDAASIARHAHDMTIARNTFIPFPYRLEHARQFIGESHKHWRKGTAFHLGIEDPDSGKIVGCVGLECIDHKHRNAEIGYWLGRAYRGRGMMSEALGLALRVAFRELKLVRVYAHTAVNNQTSGHVLKRAGFQFEGRLRKRVKHRGRYKDLLLYSILRDEFRQ